MGKGKKLLHWITYILFLLIPLFVFPENRKSGREVKVVDFGQLRPLLQKENDTVYVVNFWATWCAPCIKEVPYFERLGEKYRDRNVKVLMVSLDMPNQLQTRLIPFIEKQKMQNEVVLLDDPRSNHWIPLVEKNWTGVIPATLIYRNGFRQFYPRELTLAELEEIVRSLLNQ